VTPPPRALSRRNSSSRELYSAMCTPGARRGSVAHLPTAPLPPLLPARSALCSAPLLAAGPLSENCCRPFDASVSGSQAPDPIHVEISGAMQSSMQCV
jgi:hypothetical protein